MEWILEIMEWIIANWESILLIISGVISVASIIVKLTPTPKDDAILAKVVSFLKILSLNKSKK